MPEPQPFSFAFPSRTRLPLLKHRAKARILQVLQSKLERVHLWLVRQLIHMTLARSDLRSLPALDTSPARRRADRMKLDL
jgi:hypothetical protein